MISIGANANGSYNYNNNLNNNVNNVEDYVVQRYLQYPLLIGKIFTK